MVGMGGGLQGDTVVSNYTFSFRKWTPPKRTLNDSPWKNLLDVIYWRIPPAEWITLHPRTTPSCLPGLGSGTQRFWSPQPCFSPFLKPWTGSFLRASISTSQNKAWDLGEAPQRPMSGTLPACTRGRHWRSCTSSISDFHSAPWVIF